MMYRIVKLSNSFFYDFYVIDQYDNIVKSTRYSVKGEVIKNQNLESAVVYCEKSYKKFISSQDKRLKGLFTEVLRFDRDIPISEQYPEYFI